MGRRESRSSIRCGSARQALPRRTTSRGLRSRPPTATTSYFRSQPAVQPDEWAAGNHAHRSAADRLGKPCQDAQPPGDYDRAPPQLLLRISDLNRPFNLTNGPQGITLIDPLRIGSASLAKTHTLAGITIAPLHSYYFVFPISTGRST